MRHILSLPVVRYFWVSLAGFVLDCALFALLHITLSLPPLPANLASATAAVTFVYFASARRIFLYKGGFLIPKFMAYLAYQTTVIILFSWLIATIAETFALSALGIKMGIVPLQFIMNYLVLREILRRFEHQ